MKIASISVPLFVCSVLCSGCGTIKTTYFPVNNVPIPPTTIEQVEVSAVRPTKATLVLGVINLQGSRKSFSHDHLIHAAKRIASSKGADVIWVFDAGRPEQPYLSPGLAIFRFQDPGSGFGSSGFGVGPSSGPKTRPTLSVISGHYLPAKVPWFWDEKLVSEGRFKISRFTIDRKGKEAGLEVATKLLASTGLIHKTMCVSQIA